MARPQANWLVRNRLKMRQLVLLLNIYELKSVVHAAEATGISQPAASKLLTELEDALGVQLFRRHTRGVEPTWYAEVLVRHAYSALSEMGRAHEEITSLKAGQGGRATVGTVLNPGINLLPQAIIQLKQAHPNITVSVEMDYSKAMVARLLNGQLDMVIGRILDMQDVNQLSFEPLADEPHALIVRGSHPLLRRKKLDLKQLLEFGWVLPAESSVLRSRIDRLIMTQGLLPPVNVVESFSFPFIKAMITLSDMITVLPAEVFNAELQSGSLAVLPLDLGIGMESFGIVTRRHHQLTPSAEMVVQAVREVAASIYNKPPGRGARHKRAVP